MTLSFAKIDNGFRAWFQVVRSNGLLRTGATFTDFTALVIDPVDITATEFFVSESAAKSGLYYFDIPPSYLVVSGTGDYGVSVEIDIGSPPKVTNAFSDVLKINQEDFDSISGSVWNALTSSYSNAGTFGEALSSLEASVTNEGVTISTSSLDSIVSGVWGGQLADHAISGSIGEWIQRMAYNHMVYIDTIGGGDSGSVFPRGTKEFPVDNETDARLIADRYSFNRYNVRGDLTLTQAHDQWTFIGQGDGGTLDINGVAVSSARFIDIKVSGTFSGGGNYVVERGLLNNVSNFRGFAIQTGFDGTVEIGSGKTSFHQCYSRTPGSGTPILNVNGGSGRTFNMRSYSGGLTIHSMSNGNNSATVEFIAGQLIFDDSCTAGSAEVRGVTQITDNSGGTFAFNAEAALARSPIADVVWDEVAVDHNTSGTMGYLQNLIDNIELYSSQSLGVVNELSGSGVTINQEGTDTIVSGVWDANAASFNTAGTMGRLQNTAGAGGVDIDLLVSGVWNAVADGFETSGTMGGLMNKIVVMSGSIEKIRKIECGRWQISGSQQIFYDDDSSTPLAIFNLFKPDGSPFIHDDEAVVERVLTSSLA